MDEFSEVKTNKHIRKTIYHAILCIVGAILGIFFISTVVLVLKNVVEGL